MKSILKPILKFLALLYGIVGVTWLILGCYAIKYAIVEKDAFGIVMILIFFALGGIVTAISAQVLLKWSREAVRNLCLLVGLSVYSIVARALQPAADSMLDRNEMSGHAALMILPVVLGVATYHLAKRFTLNSIKDNTKPAI